LSWIVTTDHGGPQHAKLNIEQAYPELLRSRAEVPDLLQFYGLELNMPGMDHHTLIIPHAEFESSALYDLESRFDANDPATPEPERRTAETRRRALAYMSSMMRVPLVFANHPSRSAKALGTFGLDEPWEIRESADVAPEVYKGMEGAPGHQASGLARDGQPRIDDEGNREGARGGYANAAGRTLGGFDQMTAVVGGFWDSLLGEGRRFWVVATSDSHVHYTEATRRGSDFWPGEFHKTYVYARKTYDSVLEGLRTGRIFVTAGDLITSLDIEATSGDRRAGVGETLRIDRGGPIALTIRFRDPDGVNAHGFDPRVTRVDVITGAVRGPLIDKHASTNETTRVVARYGPQSWRREGEDIVIESVVSPVAPRMYVRVRGTNTMDLEPRLDALGEDPWSDVWFYSNPIFIDGVSQTTVAGPGGRQ
jgi:hypothetical protein